MHAYNDWFTASYELIGSNSLINNLSTKVHK